MMTTKNGINCMLIKKMDELVKIKTQGAIIRSRQQWYEEGEKHHDILST